jgi:hypothetical protein
MRSSHPLRNAFALAALTALGGTVGLSSAAAEASPQPVQPHQAFVGQVNGNTVDAVITVGCFGPVSATSTGHPVAGQSVSAHLLPGEQPASTVGYTGESADRLLVGFGNSFSTQPAPTPTVIKAYDVKVPIPQDLNLPCYGTGKVVFVPAPASKTQQSATVDVTYVSIGLSPTG